MKAIAINLHGSSKLFHIDICNGSFFIFIFLYFFILDFTFLWVFLTFDLSLMIYFRYVNPNRTNKWVSKVTCPYSWLWLLLWLSIVLIMCSEVNYCNNTIKFLKQRMRYCYQYNLLKILKKKPLYMSMSAASRSDFK